MTFNTRALVDTATVWEIDGVDSAGDPQFSSASPYTISVRWEERAETFRSTDGATRESQHVVHLAQDLDPGDYLYLGTSTEADPEAQFGALKVEGFSKIKSINGQKIERRAFL